jgi:hypothetical protein
MFLLVSGSAEQLLLNPFNHEDDDDEEMVEEAEEDALWATHQGDEYEVIDRKISIRRRLSGLGLDLLLGGSSKESGKKQGQVSSFCSA